MAKKPTPKKSSHDEYLPSEPIEPSGDFDSYMKLIYGPKGIGKSTLVSTFPDTLVNMTEKGRANLRIYQWPDWRTKLAEDRNWSISYEEEQNFLTHFVENAEGQFKQLAIDTIDQLWNIAVSKTYADHNITDMSGLPYGQAWGITKDNLYALLDIVHGSPMGLVLVSHVTTKDRESFVDEENTETTLPTMDKRAWAWVCERVDFVFLYDMVGNDRVLVVRGGGKIYASCGPEGCFMDQNGEPIRRILMPDDPKKGYETILAGFNNELSDYDREKARKAALRQQQAKSELKKRIAKK